MIEALHEVRRVESVRCLIGCAQGLNGYEVGSDRWIKADRLFLERPENSLAVGGLTLLYWRLSTT